MKTSFLQSANCKIRYLALLMFLTLVSTHVWGTDYSLTPNQTSTGSDARAYITTLTEFTYDGVSWKMNQWNPSTLQIKTNQSSATSEFRFYNTSAFSGRITKVVITFSALTVSDASKLMFLGGTSEVTATTGGTAGTWDSEAKTLTWTPGESDNFTYFAFYQNGKAASGNNYLASKSAAIVVTYASCSGTQLATPDVTATPSSGQVVLSWSAVANATKYQLSWNGGVWADATSPVTKTGLTNGTEYTYQVKAIGDGSTYCDSDPSEEASAIPGTYYTVTFMSNGVTYDTKSIRSGSNLILPTAPASCDAEKEFVGWTATNIGSTPTDTKPTFVSSQTTISSAQTYYAVFATKTSNKYVLGSKTDLIDDRKVLIVNPSNNSAMSGANSSGKLTGTSVSISSSTITNSSTSIIWTVKPQADGKYKFIYGGNELYATANNSLWCDGDDYTDSWTVTANSSHYILTSSYCSKNLEYYSGFTVYNTGTTAAYQMDFYIPEYKNYITTCCTPLGTINGSVNLSQSGGTLTATLPDANKNANATSYRFTLYDNSDTEITHTDVATTGSGSDVSTSFSSSNVVVGNTYKVSCTPLVSPQGSFCSTTGTESAKVSFTMRIYIHINNGATRSDWNDYYLTNTGTNTGTITVPLEANTGYGFKITDQSESHWWGVSSESSMTSSNCSSWWLNNTNYNCGITSAMAGDYVFTVDYSDWSSKAIVSVTYPSADQTSGKKIYWDNSILDWSTYKYRIGNGAHAQTSDATLVPGTDKFYYYTTPAYNNMAAWHIANNTASTSDIYTTTGDNAITAATAYQQYVVTGDITIVPTETHSTGGESKNSNCEFYTVTKTDGMLTHTATITAPTGGTIRLDYTDVNSASQSKTVTTAGLAHRTKITATAAPATGYNLTAFTVTPSGDAAINLLASNGTADNHILAKDATFAATFTAKTTTVTLNAQGGTGGTASVTAAYGNAMPAATMPTKTGYAFAGYFTETGGEGTKYYNADGSSARNWDKDTESATTLYANWTKNNYTLTWNLDGGKVTTAGTGAAVNATGSPSSSVAYGTDITAPVVTKEGYDFSGWSPSVASTMPAANTTYTAQWTLNKYTVTWHVGETTTTTSNVNHGTTFSTLEASAPAHADNALSACGSTKFIGWVKAGGVYTEDGKTVDWYNTHKFSGSDEITDNTHIYAMYAEASGSVVSYDLVTSSSSALSGGDEILIIGTNEDNSPSYYGLGCQRLNAAGDSYVDNRAAISVTINNGTLSPTPTIASETTNTTNVYPLQLVAIENSTNFRIKDIVNNKYFAAKGGTGSSPSNKLNIDEYSADDGKQIWSISIASSTSYATINVASTSATRNTIWFNSTNNNNGVIVPIFSCYASGASQKHVYIYRKSDGVTYSNYRTGCTVTCGAPSSLTNASISKTGATISWTGGGNGELSEYEYAVWVDGDTEPTSGFTSNGTNTSKALTGLYSGIKYKWKVRKVCTDSDGESRWSYSDFTTTAADLTFSVPTGVSAVAGQKSNVNLPEAGVPTACGSCWVFAGWTASTTYSDEDAPADLMAAGTKARVSGDKTLYAVYANERYYQISEVAEVTANEYYIISFDQIGMAYVMTPTVVESYYTSSANIHATTSGSDVFMTNVTSNMLWKFTGTTSAGRFYSESGNKYIDLSDEDNPPVAASTTDYVNITKFDSESKKFNIGSNTTAANYLQVYEGSVWGIDEDHDGYYSAYLFKRNVLAYATSPDCGTYTVTWDVNNGASTSSSSVNACEGYISSMPSAPADNTLSSCMTNSTTRKFVGWSPTKVMPAQDERPSGLFNSLANSPYISDDVTFYAVFANQSTGGEAAINKTYTFTSASWGDSEDAWVSGKDGNWNSSAVQVPNTKDGANATTVDTYNAVTKVAVTYFTNAKNGAGSIDIQVNGTSYTGNTSVTKSGGTTPRTINFTPPSSALSGKVNITVSCTANSIYITSVQIFYTGSTTTYTGYRTACCNDAGLGFLDDDDNPVDELTIVREDLEHAIDYGTIDFSTTSLNTTGAITWASTVRQKSVNNTKYTWSTVGTNQSSTGEFYVDVTNGEIKGKNPGIYVVTLSQAQGATNYCPAEASVTVTVKTIDKFIDAVNGNNGGDILPKADTGDGITLPTEAEFTINNECKSTTRRLVGWIKESDLPTTSTGYIDTLKTSDPATNKVIAPGTRVTATGITWYAVWGEEQL